MYIHEECLAAFGVYLVMSGKGKNSSRGIKKMKGVSRWIIVTVVLAVLIVLGVVLSSAFLQSNAKLPLTAVIVDQLGTDFPDPSFVLNVTATLMSHGFSVAYFNSSLNVSFFRNLASSNYGIVILREHSALRNDSSTVDLFTSEKYVVGAYQDDVDNGLLTKGEFTYEPGEFYFCLSPLFIGNLQGRFPSSIVIAMGCQSLIHGDNPMADAFIAKGAKAYFGWSDIVFPQDTDTETMNLLSMMFSENKTLGDAVGSTYPHSYTGYFSLTNQTVTNVETRLELFPLSNENLTVSQLIDQSKQTPSSSLSDVAGFLILCPALSRVSIMQKKHQ